ncbi:hypothetical protein Trydic_g13153 [Trypoxylus dichotomus]
MNKRDNAQRLSTTWKRTLFEYCISKLDLIQISQSAEPITRSRTRQRKIHHRPKRCLVAQNKAEALVDTLVHFSSNCRKDPEQENVFQNTLGDIDGIDAGFPISYVIRRGANLRELSLLPKPMEDHHSSEGYHLMSLLNTISKVLKTLLLARITDHLDKHHLLLDDDQLGFRLGHSITSQLFRIIDHATAAFNRKQIGVIVSLDLQKTFDKICHEGLLLKVKNSGFSARILKAIRSYFQTRRFYTIVNGSGTSARRIESGPEDYRVFNAVYAIVATSRRSKVAAGLAQPHLAKIEFFGIWGLDINPRKTQAIAFTRTYQELQ